LNRIYADHNATTPVHPAVLEAMLPYLRENFGNPSSVHYQGRQARAAIDDARLRLSRLIGCAESELVFTGGGTESDNAVIFGVRPGHIITSAVEHHAVLHAARHRNATLLPVNRDCLVDPDDLKKAIRPDTVLVSIMAVNNETGTIQPVKELAGICRERGVLFHTDAVQAFGKLPVNVDDWGVDLLSISAHKFYGPKGVGALYIRRGVRLSPLLVGGAHENQRRAGTENVAGIVGLVKSAEMAVESMPEEQPRLFALTEKLAAGILAQIPGARRNGHGALRIAGTVNFSFAGCGNGNLVPALDLEGVSVSGGSACAAGATEPSHVLAAMGLPSELVRSAVRFSFGKGNASEDADYILKVLPEIVARQSKNR
jgi:cysteine desulfurase